MALNTIIDVVRQPSDRPGADWRPGDGWLAGGTWLFSEPQADLRRLIDLAALGPNELVITEAGLRIGAICTIHDLYAFVAPPDWRAAPLLAASCEAFLASFKVWNSATVGGNICMSLPAGPTITLTVALEATYTLWGPDGSERSVDAVGVVINPAQVRGQVEGGVAQGLGFVLTENHRVDGHGVMVNPSLRNYRIPTFANVPRTEVILVDSTDSVGPMRAKGMAECCINPVAPALANALHDATGVRYRELPLTPVRIYDRLPSGRLTATA